MIIAHSHRSLSTSGNINAFGASFHTRASIRFSLKHRMHKTFRGVHERRAMTQSKSRAIVLYHGFIHLIWYHGDSELHHYRKQDVVLPKFGLLQFCMLQRGDLGSSLGKSLAVFRYIYGLKGMNNVANIGIEENRAIFHSASYDEESKPTEKDEDSVSGHIIHLDLCTE